MLDVDDAPVCCGFFVSDSGVALTVRHGSEHWLRDGGVVHAVMLKASSPREVGLVDAVAAETSEPATCDGPGVSVSIADAAPHEVLLTFLVHSYSPVEMLDFTCMVLTSRLPKGTFRPLLVPSMRLSDAALIGAHATLMHGSIALNRQFGHDPSASLVPCSIFTVHPTRVLYSAATAGGDSGGALVISGKVLVAMHVEGVNDVRDDVDVQISTTAGVSRRKPAKRVKLSEASPSTVGAALRLDLPEIKAAINAAESSLAHGASVLPTAPVGVE